MHHCSPTLNQSLNEAAFTSHRRPCNYGTEWMPPHCIHDESKIDTKARIFVYLYFPVSYVSNFSTSCHGTINNNNNNKSEKSSTNYTMQQIPMLRYHDN